MASTSPQRKTLERAWKISETLGIDPLEILLKIADGRWQELGFEAPTIQKFSPLGMYEEHVIPIVARIDAALGAAKYLYAQQKAISVTDDTNREKIIKLNYNEPMINPRIQDAGEPIDADSRPVQSEADPLPVEGDSGTSGGLDV